MPNHDEKQRNFSLLRLVLIYAGIALLITLLLLIPGALLISSGAVPIGGILPLVLLAQGAGVLAGSRGAARRAEKRKLIMGVCVALCVFVFVLFMGIIFTYPPGSNAVISAAVILLSGLLGGLWGAQGKRKKHRA